MKKRYLYILLFSVPAMLAAIIMATLLFGAIAGLLWIFVFGDNPWPDTAGTLLMVMLVLTGLGGWVALLSVAYGIGKRQEAQAALNRRHVLAAVGATLLLVLLVVAQQWRTGNFGPKSDGELCADFCKGLGYMASGIPLADAGAATCSCFDAQGREALKVPLTELGASQGK